MKDTPRLLKLLANAPQFGCGSLNEFLWTSNLDGNLLPCLLWERKLDETPLQDNG